MMEIMLNDNDVTFKTLEQEIFRAGCKWCCEYTKQLLEGYDKHLMEHRDKKAYRNKGLRKTVIKTVYGEVEYERRLYETIRDDGTTAHVFLLDEELEIEGVGKISQNLAETLVRAVTEMSYRASAEHVSSTTGQSISAMGTWKVIQALGEKVDAEEKELVREYKNGKVRGEEETEILFEEVDGIYLNLQREKQRSAEMKVGIAYSGWKESGKNRYSLEGKVAVAGFAKTEEFRDFSEAAIAQRYDTEKIKVRLLNGDGAAWIKESAPGAVYQLDPFHRNEAIRKCLPYKRARKAVYEYLNSKDLKGLFSYLEIYKDSLSDDVEIEKAETLISYFRGNARYLIPCSERGLELPEGKEGVIYRNMGTMENHIWSIIAKRMKHNHTVWTIKGGNNLAKILAMKSCGRLWEVADKLKTGSFDPKILDEAGPKGFTPRQVPLKVGHGYEYPVRGSLPGFEGPTGSVSQSYKSYLTGF